MATFGRTHGIPGLTLALAIVGIMCGRAGAAEPAQAPSPARVFVRTDPAGDGPELRDRQQSVKDLRAALSARKKTCIVVDLEDRADVVIDVISRTTTVPKVRIGLAVPGAGGPVRVVHLRVTVARGNGDLVEFTNKNSPFETSRGWPSAAEDLAGQIDKWLKEHKARG